MGCEYSRNAELGGFADGGLPGTEQRWWKEHVAACRDCGEELARIRALSRTLRDALPRMEPSDAFHQTIRSSLRREAQFVAGSINGELPNPVNGRLARGRRRAWQRWPLGLAASLLIAAGFALGRLPRRAGGNLVVADVVAGHLRSLEVDHLLDVVSSEHHVVRPWFSGKLDFAPPVPDLAADSFPLLGARVDYLAGRSVAALVYSHGPHRINLFVRPGAEDISCGRDAPIVRQGFNLVHGHAAGMEFWAISDLNRDELVAFASRWQAQVAPGNAPCASPGGSG